MAWYNWSQTSASNGTADSSINWAEGMAPSAVNDSARAMMAATAKYRDDISGAIVTGGTSTAYTVTSNSSFDTLAHLNGQLIAFAANATSTNAAGADVTLNVDGLGTKPIRMQPGVALPGGTIISGTPYVVVYNNSDGVFYLHNMTSPYSIPLGAGIDFWGTTTPNSSFAFPTGQAISRTTYATAFSMFGTTFGSGDGSTTFNLPDKTERVSVMKAATASRLTTAGSGVDGGTLGATGGAQNVTIAQAGLPNVTLSATLTGNVTTSATIIEGSALANVQGGATQGSISTGGAIVNTNTLAVSVTGNTASINGNTTQTATKTVQPTIVCNYILRII